MSKPTWLDDEPRAGDFVRQTADLLSGGFRRPFLTLALSALFVAVVAAVLVFGKRVYAPHVLLRIVEGDGDPSAQPRPHRQLGEYVRDAVFTSEPLLELIRKHGLYPSLVKRNPRAALESFREDIDIEVYRNYFVEERAPGSAPRTARVAVGYSSSDRAVALDVTRELAALIERHEARVRRAQAERARGRAERARATLQGALQRRSEQVAAKRSEIILARAPDPELQVELVNLLGSLESLELALDGATHRAATFELGAALEQGGVGLHFEVADDASLPSDAERSQFVRVSTLASFLFGLPLIAAGVGALAPRRPA